MGRISENEIWMPEPESKVSRTFSSSCQAHTPRSGCGPCFGDSYGACPRARFCLPHVLMVLIFLTRLRNIVTPVWGVDGQEPGTKISEPGGLQNAGNRPSAVQSQAMVLSQIQPPSSHNNSTFTVPWLFGMTENMRFTDLTLLPTPNLVLGKTCDLPSLVGDVCHLPTHALRGTPRWYHLLSSPGCPSPTVHRQLLGEEPAVCAGTAVPA